MTYADFRQQTDVGRAKQARRAPYTLMANILYISIAAFIITHKIAKKKFEIGPEQSSHTKLLIPLRQALQYVIHAVCIPNELKESGRVKQKKILEGKKKHEQQTENCVHRTQKRIE